MKPAPFKYFAPDTIPEALSLLAEHGYDAKILAGGQSLVPMMNFRLVQPAVIVDINNIPDMAYIQPDGKGLKLGPMTRHRRVELDPLLEERAPLINEAMPRIATVQVRNRGTFGGSLAHADPSAELVAVTTALGASFKIQSQQGERLVPAEEFFSGLLMTVMEPEEMLVEVQLPPLPQRTGWSLQEITRRAHDFAIMGVAAVVTLDKSDRCQDASLVYLSAGDGPVAAREAVELLVGEEITRESIEAAADKASSEEIDPGNDIHATADFRRHLARVLTQRALEIARDRARSGR
jgi:carbon-monoxide dehydrogenase medium subunit